MQVAFTDYSEHSEFQLRSLTDIQWIMIHRIKVADDALHYSDTPEGIARFFREHPEGKEATGGKMPYSILIDGNGKVTQTVPLEKITPHARKYNQNAIGVGCIGDFRSATPGASQYAMLVEVCSSLLCAYDLGVKALIGHDGLEGSSADPNKECPGAALNLETLRENVSKRLRQGELSQLHLFLALLWLETTQ